MTTVITPFVITPFLWMLFGLKNTIQSFQCLMDTVCRDLPFVFLITSASLKQHLEHLCLLFEQFMASLPSANSV